MRAGQRRRFHGDSMSRAGCHALAAAGTARFHDARLRRRAWARGETNGPRLAMVFTGAAQHAPMRQAGRVDRSLERPGRKVGGKNQGGWLGGCILPGVFHAGMSAVCAECAMRAPEIGLRESSHALRKQSGGTGRHACATTGTHAREKRFVYCPRGAIWDSDPTRMLTTQESAATHIHKLSPILRNWRR